MACAAAAPPGRRSQTTGLVVVELCDGTRPQRSRSSSFPGVRPRINDAGSAAGKPMVCRLYAGGKGIRTIGPRKRISVFRKPPRPPSPPGEAVSPKNLPFLVQADSSLVFPQFATPRLRHHPLATRALPAHAPYVAANPSSQNAPPGRCGNLSPVVHTEDLTVRFGGLPTLNRVNSEASETKGLALDVIAPLRR